MKARRKYMVDLMNRILKVRYESLELEQELCEELVGIAQKENYTYGETFAYVYLVDCYLMKNNSLVCGTYLRKAKDLCEREGYYELLLPLYNFAGLYHQRMGDEQTALTYYLEGLDFARDQKNRNIECMLLNNIGWTFQARGDITTAKKYFKEALEVFLPEMNQDNVHFSVIYLCNLAEVSQILNEIKDSAMYLRMCEKIDTEGSYKKYRLLLGWCGHYAASQNQERCLKYAKLVLEEHLDELGDQYFASESFISIFKYMQDIDNPYYAKIFLELAKKGLEKRNLESCFRLYNLTCSYYRKYGSKRELLAACKEYFQFVQERKVLNDKVRADGILSKIRLLEAIEEKETIYHENIRLEDASYLDETTGIYNRRYMNKQVLKVFGKPDGRKAGFIMLDVDYFKEYNDFYGHLKGDEVLKTIASCLWDNRTENILPCRYGGDEFTCLCLGLSAGAVEDYVLRVRRDLYDRNIRHEKSKCSDRVTLSIGYACGEGDYTPQLLQQMSDEALYEAKQCGRNSYARKRVESA